ncbi:MAG: ABC transporter permease subunit [Polyangiaceae bacterium]
MRTRGLVLASLALALALTLDRTARADVLDDVRARGALVWGADQEGGGPYVFPRDDDSTVVTGFEVELADAIASEMGVKAKFHQGNWDKLPDLARTGEIDIVLNGYEWTEDRAQALEASKPYYVYALQLLVPKTRTDLTWETLAKPQSPKRKVGVLTGSAAEEAARSQLGDAVEVVTYDGNTDSMKEVENGKLDATIQDTPIVAFYGERFPGLVRSGDPIREGLYVIYAKRGEKRLIEAIDAALVALQKSGKLSTILARYGLLDAQQKRLEKELGPVDKPVDASAPPIKAGERKRGLRVVADYAGVLGKAALLTVVLSVASFPLAVILGLAVAVLRLWGPRWLRPVFASYVEFLRGTPLMLQLYVLFFMLPELGVRLSAFPTAIIGLALNYSAYESEIYRAGLQAVPEGQTEAGLALGMSRWGVLRHVVIPQATRIVIPPVVNDFVALFKDTSVCSVVTLVELTKQYSVLSMSTQATVELTIMTAILYLAMSLPLSFVARRLEQRLARGSAR